MMNRSLLLLALLFLISSQSFAQFSKEDGGKEYPGYVIDKSGNRIAANIRIPRGKVPSLHMLWKVEVFDGQDNKVKYTPKDILGFGHKRANGDSVHFRTIPTPSWYWSYDKTHCFAGIETKGKITRYRIDYEGDMQNIIEGRSSVSDISYATNGGRSMPGGASQAVFVLNKQGSSNSYAENEKNAKAKLKDDMADCPAVVADMVSGKYDATVISDIVKEYNAQCGQ